MTGKPSIDKPWLKYYPDGADKIPIPQMTVYQYLYDRNKSNMGSIALEYYGSKISYDVFFKCIDTTAKSFTALGVKQNDIVTIMMPNTPEAIYCFYALNKIGACANMISPALTPDYIKESINLTESKILIILDKFFSVFNNAIEKSNIEKTIITSPTTSLPPHIRFLASIKQKAIKFSKTDKYLKWSQFFRMGKTKNEILQSTFKKDTPAVIVYSSGSTGISKGIVLSNESFTALTLQRDVENSYMTRERGQMRCLTMLPMFLSTGINVCIDTMLCFNQTLILEPQFNANVFINAMKKLKPNFTLSPTSLFEKLLGGSFGDMSSLRVPIAGGEPLSLSLENTLNELFEKNGSTARMMKGWGMCEFGSAVTHTVENERVRKGTGKPLSHVVIGVFDLETDEELGYNKRGEIRVITPCRMLEYYKNPEATNEFFRKGNDEQVWGCSGDIGYIDEQGNVFIEGRADDYIYSGNGNKIWLFEIENIILADNDVELCEAVGLTVNSIGIPVVHLVLRQENIEPLEELIIRIHESCVTQLSKDAIPQGYKIRDSFNVSPSGKRDTLSLKNDFDSFFTVDSNKVRMINFL